MRHLTAMRPQRGMNPKGVRHPLPKKCLTPPPAAAGQITAEIAVAFVMIIGALVGMAVYLQRGVQGQLFEASRAHGMQFDPADPYTEVNTLNTRTEDVFTQTQASLIGADLIDTPDELELFKIPWVPPGKDAYVNAYYTLPSVPTGPVLREPTWTQSKVQTEWNVSSKADYEQQQR